MIAESAQPSAAELSEAASPAPPSGGPRRSTRCDAPRPWGALMFARPGDARALRTRCTVLVVRGTRRDTQRVSNLGRRLSADGVRCVDAILLPGNLADLPRPVSHGEDGPAPDAGARAASGEGEASNILGLFEHVSLEVLRAGHVAVNYPCFAERGRAGRDPVKPPKLTNLSVCAQVVGGTGGGYSGCGLWERQGSRIAGLLADIRAWLPKSSSGQGRARAAGATALSNSTLDPPAPECDGFRHGARSVGGVAGLEQGLRRAWWTQSPKTVLVNVVAQMMQRRRRCVGLAKWLTCRRPPWLMVAAGLA